MVNADHTSNTQLGARDFDSRTLVRKSYRRKHSLKKIMNKQKEDTNSLIQKTILCESNSEMLHQLRKHAQQAIMGRFYKAKAVHFRLQSTFTL